MQARKFCPSTVGKWLVAWSGVGLSLALAACGSADNPYSKISDPPLVAGTLHVVTLVSDSGERAREIVAQGYAPVKLPPNYQQADAVEAALWGVPEPVAAAVQHFKGDAGRPDLRLLVMPLAARGREADDKVNRAFFRNVLGVDVPRWPLARPADDDMRVQVWTYRVPSIIEAGKRMRANGIPVIYDPVAITTSYLGLQKTLAIRAPDGTVVQLVEISAQ